MKRRRNFKKTQYSLQQREYWEQPVRRLVRSGFE